MMNMGFYATFSGIVIEYKGICKVLPRRLPLCGAGKARHLCL